MQVSSGAQVVDVADSETYTTAADETKDAARAWINKLSVKAGYDPKKFPNPGAPRSHLRPCNADRLSIALKLYYEQLQAVAFDEPYNFDEFDDPSAPPYPVIHDVSSDRVPTCPHC